MDRNTKTGKPQERTVLPYILEKKGFTLIELMIVLSIIAILATLAIPSYQNATIRAKEAVLKVDLFQLRDIIDQYYSDFGAYPDNLEDLVSKHYIRDTPVDPFTKSKDSWIIIPPPMEGIGNVFDVKSGSNLASLDGVPYNEW